MPYESLEAHLDDRLAGATAAVDVARQAAQRRRSSEPGAFYAEIASEIKADVDTFEELMESPLAPLHQTAAATA
jgi:hypothetical protein